MTRGRAGRGDWVALLAVAALVTAVAAMVTAVAVVVQVQKQSELSRFNAGLASLWQLRSEWNGDDMLDVRSAAAEALLDGQGGDDVDAVLDFFDEVAFLMRRGAVDEELVWYQFYWPMVHYWAGCREYAGTVRQKDPTAWEQLDAAMPTLLAIEARRRGGSAASVTPDRAAVRDFLQGEVGDSACSDDDARRTPL